jgi:hypothetical protein
MLPCKRLAVDATQDANDDRFVVDHGKALSYAAHGRGSQRDSGGEMRNERSNHELHLEKLSAQQRFSGAFYPHFSQTVLSSNLALTDWITG